VTEFPPLADIYNTYAGDDYAHFVINCDNSSRWAWLCGIYNDNPDWRASTAWLWDETNSVGNAYRSVVGIAYSRLQYFIVDLDGNIRFAYSGTIKYNPTIVTNVIDELL
jgi:hypothetical protein